MESGKTRMESSLHLEKLFEFYKQQIITIIQIHELPASIANCTILQTINNGNT